MFAPKFWQIYATRSAVNSRSGGASRYTGTNNTIAGNGRDRDRDREEGKSKLPSPLGSMRARSSHYVTSPQVWLTSNRP